MECEGACEMYNGGHSGPVVRVHVTHPDHAFLQDWGKWNYCQNAILEDKSRGFTVKVEDENSANLHT